MATHPPPFMLFEDDDNGSSSLPCNNGDSCTVDDQNPPNINLSLTLGTNNTSAVSNDHRGQKRKRSDLPFKKRWCYWKREINVKDNVPVLSLDELKSLKEDHTDPVFLYQKCIKDSDVDPNLNRLLKSLKEDHTEPVFLYQKYIEHSDVDSNLNRLFLSRSDKLVAFFTDEERMAMMSGKGIEISGFDASQGEESPIHIIRWNSQTRPVFYKSWKRWVQSNGVKEGDIIEVRGCRKTNQQLLLIINFRKPRQVREIGTCSTSI